MKQVIHKILAINMAFVVLMTTMSFTVNMHYCGKVLVDYSVFNAAKTCGMEKMQPAFNCELAPIAKKSCCSNKQLIVEGQDDLKKSFYTLSFEQQFFVAIFSQSYINLFKEKAATAILFADYPPPFLKQDILVLHQIFLI